MNTFGYLSLHLVGIVGLIYSPFIVLALIDWALPDPVEPGALGGMVRTTRMRWLYWVVTGRNFTNYRSGL